MKIIKSVIMCLCIFGLSYAEQFKMSDKVIKAKISYQNLNRIGIKGDKIDSILGVESAFHVEKNDRTGEAFIRPTVDNGYAPISLSVTTALGKTQDFLLEPIDGEANSIELISNTHELSLPMDFLGVEESSNYEEAISAVMKKFINLPVNYPDIDVTCKDRVYSHIKATFESAYRIDGYLCLKFNVTTTKEGKFVLDEKMFSMQGDIALSLSSLKLCSVQVDSKKDSKIKVMLYVLRK